jgi:hypothetical protein
MMGERCTLNSDAPHERVGCDPRCADPRRIAACTKNTAEDIDLSGDKGMEGRSGSTGKLRRSAAVVRAARLACRSKKARRDRAADAGAKRRDGSRRTGSTGEEADDDAECGLTCGADPW